MIISVFVCRFGLFVLIFNGFEYSLALDDERYKKHVVPGSPSELESLGSLFSRPKATMIAMQLRVVNDCLDNDYLLSPEDLRWRLLYAEMLNKLSLGLTPVTPSYFKRKVMWVNPMARALLVKLE